jgi:hypothetical protein
MPRVEDEAYPENPGDYGLVNGEWCVCAPDGGRFMLASVAHPDQAGNHHEVEVHDDGTISVMPRPGNSNSILSPRGWHGYIDRGEWSRA